MPTHVFGLHTGRPTGLDSCLGQYCDLEARELGNKFPEHGTSQELVLISLVLVQPSGHTTKDLAALAVSEV